MPSNYTEHCQLSQWKRADKVLMEDFNADNAKIDAALKAETDARAAADSAINAALSKRGNCQAYITSYVGNGQYGQSTPNQITLPWAADALFVLSQSGTFLFSMRGDTLFHPTNLTSPGSGKISWNGTSISWYNDSYYSQLNIKGTLYHVLAFRALS